MTLTKTASFVFSALLGSPRAGEAFAPFAMHDVSMVSTTMPSHGMSRGAVNIPTSGSTSGAGTARVSRDQKRSASSSTAPSRFSGESEEADIHHGHGHDQQQHPASAFYFADEDATTPPPAAQIPSTPAQRDHLPPPAPPEPEGGAAAGVNDAFQSAYNRPWRKRARDARARTVFENTQGVGSEGSGQEGSGDAMRQRASEKEEVVASRKETKKKALNRAALPIVDLIGIMSPLVIIVGMSMVQNVP